MLSILHRLYRHTRRTILASELVRASTNSEALKWGIVGTGYMASVWADLLLSSGSSELLAVCSRKESNATQFRRKFGGKNAFSQLDDMLATLGDELDIIYIATPLSSHFEITTRCLDAGVNVLVEKPATETQEQWSLLSNLAKQRNVVLIEGMWMRCLPTFRQAGSWIDEGLIGDVRWIRADLNKFRPLAEGRIGGGSGVLMDYGVYGLSFVRHFLGGPPEWYKCSKHLAIDGADTEWSIMIGRQRKTGIINISANSDASSRAAIIGDSGIIEWGSPFNRTSQITLHDFTSGGQLSKKFSYKHQGFEHQLDEVRITLQNRLAESKILDHNSTLDVLRITDNLIGKK